MKIIIIIFLILTLNIAKAQFSADLVLVLHSGTQSEMNSMNSLSDKAKLFFNTTDNRIYYHDGSNWIWFGHDNQNISGSYLNGDVLTIGIENGNSENVDLSSLRDNLGNHTASENIKLNGNYFSGDGNNEGVFVDGNGNVGVNILNPNSKLDVNGKSQNKNIRIMVGSNTSVNTTSTTFVDVPGLSTTINTADAHLLIMVNIPAIRNDDDDQSVNFRIVVDGIEVGGIVEEEDSHTSGGIIWNSTFHALTAVIAGSHTIKVQWSTQGSTARINDGQNFITDGKRTMTIIEL